MKQIDDVQISQLIEKFVKNEFLRKKDDKYEQALIEFETKLKTVNVKDYGTADEFVYECLNLFEEIEDDGPEEIYKGLNKEDVQLLLDGLIKRFKELLCDAFQNDHNANFSDATNGIFEKNVEFLAASVISAAGIAGIPAMYIGMMLVTFLTYISKSKIQQICS